MIGTNEYIGLALDDEFIRLARVKVEGKQLKLVRLDQFSLVEEIKSGSRRVQQDDDVFREEEIDEEADSIFGLEEGEEEEEDLDLELDALGEEEDDDMVSMDMVEESETQRSNDLLLYNIISDIDPKKVNLGLNIPAGNTIFQVIRDTNFKEVKKKDLIEDLEEKLESIYGMPKTSDNYSYEIRENGSLLLASIDDESALLQLVNGAREYYTGKIIIDEIIPDEVGLAGMVRANYDLEADQITGIVQFSPRKCRIIFMKGEEIWQVSPLINEGTRNKSFLNTVFSKILFQLDTGEVPNLDRIIIANNTLGAEAIDFFKKNFPDIMVGEFRFDETLFSFEDLDPATASSFTTAISMAWAASGFERDAFPAISLIPGYIIDRQKIFKLQWHGIIILILLFATPITFNYFYQQNVQQINSLNSELQNINSQIAQINSTVEATNQLSDNLMLLRDKLVLLDTLSSGSREWSAKLQVLNNGISNVRSSWITSMTQSGEGTRLQGYTLYRSRVESIVNIFEEATLLSVNRETVREQELFQFNIMVQKFTAADSLYSPPTPASLQEILNN